MNLVSAKLIYYLISTFFFVDEVKPPQINPGSLVWRCHEHPQYRELFNFGEVKGEWLRAPDRDESDPQSQNKVLGIHCDTVFVGRVAAGESKILEPHSLARIVVINPEAHVLMDVLVRQRLPCLDLRPHLTQLNEEILAKATCSFEEARLQLLHLLSPEKMMAKSLSRRRAFLHHTPTSFCP